MSARLVLARNLSLLMETYPEVGSQKLLFKSTGVTTSTIGRIRRAEVSATLDNIEAIAKAFKISVPQLLDPNLPRTLNVLPNFDSRFEAMSFADEVINAALTESQLHILRNTLAAMQSG